MTSRRKIPKQMNSDIDLLLNVDQTPEKLPSTKQ